MTEQMFDLSPEQQFFITKTAEAAAEAMVDKLTGGDCPFPCSRVANVEADVSDVKKTIFGPYENPGGMVAQVDRLTERMRLVLWIAALSAGAGASAFGYTVASAIARHIH